MKKVLLTASYKGQPLEIVKGLVPEMFELITLDSNTHEDFVDKASDVDYILASGNIKIDRDVLDAAKGLQMVQRLGVGMDSIDLPMMQEREIPVYVNKGVNAGSVAEHAIMLILASLRRLPVINQNTKTGIWKKQEQGVLTRELSCQTVGIIGGGNIGRRVAALLRPFNCRVVYFDPFRLPKEMEDEFQMEYKELDELLASSDVITLHCPLTDTTKRIICEENLEKMKSGVIIVNTSRGGLVDETAMLDALNSGKVGFAGLDVFAEEPIKDLTLVGHEHVICTPHIAGNSYDSFVKMMECAFRNITLFDEGRKEEIEEFRVK